MNVIVFIVPEVPILRPRTLRACISTAGRQLAVLKILIQGARVVSTRAQATMCLRPLQSYLNYSRVSPLITPMTLPYIIPHIAPCKEFRHSSLEIGRLPMVTSLGYKANMVEPHVFDLSLAKWDCLTIGS